MKTTLEMNTLHSQHIESNSLAKRIGVLSYGFIAYTVGCIGLFWLVLSFGGFAPVGLSEFKAESTGTALFINIVLIALFAAQHTIMARPVFKNWLATFLPEATTRSSYMLMSGVFSIVAIYFWQPLPGTIWIVENTTLKLALWSAYSLAWVYLLVATFVTNHFELMGLRQVYLYFRNKPYTSLPFTQKLMYRYSRHPMMLGFLVGMWCVPVMSLAHMSMAVLLTAYIFMGIYFEERDLIKNFGSVYRQYKKEIATFIPGVY